jgi:DNA repair protein RadC
MQARQLSYLEEPLLRRLPIRERPVQRIAECGEQAISQTELLALLIGGPRQLETAWQLLETHGSLPALARTSPSELKRAGLSKEAVARLRAAFELARRLVKDMPEERPQIRSPGDAAALLMAELSHREQEHLWVLFLDTRNRVLGSEMVYKGSLNQSLVRAGDVFREAVRRNCAAIIVAHNHPSGDPTPSPEDVSVTRELVSAGRLLGIELVDHLVIGHQRWVSLRERGLGFDR